jgi:hypothetical protein
MKSFFIILLYTIPLSAFANNVIVDSGENIATLDTSTAGSCQVSLVEKFSRFAIAQAPAHTKENHILIKQDFETGKGCFEGYRPQKITVKANPIDIRSGKVSEKKIWEFTEFGVSGEVNEGFSSGLYTIKEPGCCSASDTLKIYSLNTGTLIGSSTVPLIGIGLANTNFWRFLTIEDRNASSPHGSKEALATLYYSDVRSIKEIVEISGSAKKGDIWIVSDFYFEKNESGNISKSKWHTVFNGAGFSDQKLHISAWCMCEEEPKAEIVIPLLQDGLNIDSAVIKGNAKFNFNKKVNKINM